MTPITILTGFLGAGKTTILNQLIEQNPDIKFGLIINEFGEVGIDGQLITNSGEEMVELSNGCMCCVVRKDLQDTVHKLLENNIDYILIETSGLAEPRPIAETFAMDNLDGKITLDGIVCILDCANYKINSENYQVALEQLQFCDIVVLNKISLIDEKQLATLKELIRKINPMAGIVENNDGLNSKLLIDTKVWSIEKLSKLPEKEEEKEHHHNHEEEHHHHEHDDVDEIVFRTQKVLDPQKLDAWLQQKLPANLVRAKGILQLNTSKGPDFFVFQMVGAFRNLDVFRPKKEVDLSFSRIVLIGKNLDKEAILQDLEGCTV